jgi:hypothetical protein
MAEIQMIRNLLWVLNYKDAEYMRANSRILGVKKKENKISFTLNKVETTTAN